MWVEEVIAWLSERVVYDEVGPELDRLAGTLRAGTVSERLAAVKQLTYMKASDSTSLLVGALRDAEPGVRGAAAEGLGYKVAGEAIAPVAVLLSDPDAGVRARAVAALNEIGLPTTRTFLGGWRTKLAPPAEDPRIADLLARALADGEAPARAAALAALPRHGARGVGLVREHLASVPEDGRARELSAAQPGLVEALGARGAEHRRAAVEALHALCGESAVRHLVVALSDPSPEVRRAAVDAVTALGPRPALDELLVSLRDADAVVVRKVVEGLMAARGLKAFTSSEEDRIHEELLRLARFTGPARDAAVWALGEMGRVSAVSTLCEVLGDTSAPPVLAACEALGKIADPRALAPLQALLDGRQPAVTSAAVRALARLQDVRVVPVFVRRLFSETAPEVEAALDQALGELTAAVEEAARGDLQSDDPAVRLRAVKLAISEPRLALSLLRAALDAPTDEVRAAALDVLAKQGYDLGALARSALLPADKAESWRVLAINLQVLLRGDGLEDLLDRLLLDSDEPPAVYRHAAAALKRLGTPKAREALGRHQKHPNADVAAAAANLGA